MCQPVILHVEDDSDDAFFVANAFDNAAPECVLHRVKDGREAIDYLDETGQFAPPGNRPKADLVVLDLKLPDVDGFEVLQWIRSQARFNKLPVLVLSGSSVEKDKERSLQLGANAYFVKTPKYEDVVRFAASLLRQSKAPLSLNKGAKPDEPPMSDSTADQQAST